MKFCASLSFAPIEELAELAQTADECGWEMLALSDHMIQPAEIRSRYPYTEDGSPRHSAFTPWPDPWVAIGYMAALTQRVRFYTSVYVLPMRNPFQVAKAVGTASLLSRERVALGIGMGWMREEIELMEQSFRNRGRRANEMIDVMRKLWGGGWVEHHGEFYDFDRLEMSPVPRAPIPIYVGGVSEPALRRAARQGDGWISDLHSTAEIAELIARLRAYRVEYGRASEPLEILVSANDAFGLDGYRRLADLGATHVLTMPWFFYGGPTESLADKQVGLRRFADDVIAKMD